MSGSTTVDWIADHADIINNIAQSMGPVQHLITGFAYVMGLCFALKAIMTLKQYGESKTAMSGGSGSMKEPLVYLFVAAVFIYFPTALAMMLNTTFGPGNVLAYSPVDSKNPYIKTLFGTGSAVGQSLAIIIQTIGGVAFVRGWVLVARASGQGQQPGGVGKGMVHIFGGILAMNIVLTLQIINNTLYGSS